MALIYEYEQKKFEKKTTRIGDKCGRKRRSGTLSEHRKRRKMKREDSRKRLRRPNKSWTKTTMGKRWKPRKACSSWKKTPGGTGPKGRATSMAQSTKAVHIYIISNIGSFGEDVFKIGTTRCGIRRSDQRESSDASVPFYFDVHATIYSENAPQLEYDLHQKFRERRLNRAKIQERNSSRLPWKK